MSDPMKLFIPLRKADAARRIVTGFATAEAPDRAGEICDYASTKPHYQKWSEDFSKASGGKSLGNLRAMHGKSAAGKIVDIQFDDAARTIEITAKIVDEAEWRKVEEGVYTGFSQGGAYVKRWADPQNPDLTRYTAAPHEISLVDLPCLPSATFELVKADGAVERRNFVAPESGGANWLDWLRGQAAAGGDAAETIGDFFAALEADVNALPIHDAPLKEILARLKTACIESVAPRPEKFGKVQSTAEAEAMRKFVDQQARALEGLSERLGALTKRLEAIEAAPAAPPLLPGFAAVAKAVEPDVDDLAAQLAKLAPEQASLLLIKAAQAQPRRFG